MRRSVSQFRLLIAVPDPDLRGAVAATLSLAGYTVTSLGTSAEAMRVLSERTIDLLVIDADIPDVYSLVRDCPSVVDRPPALCMTSYELLPSLLPEMGANLGDYVTKPCHPTELLARVQVLLRDRTSAQPAELLHYGDLLLNEIACQAWRGTKPLDLTPAEYRLLRHLLINPGQVLSKQQLAWHVWTEPRGVNAIERLVSRLRLKVDAADPALIHTRRGFGYWLGDLVPTRI